ncbi:MAG TPA: hypothetical protein VIF36_02070 [Gaiellaceae bacterium]|jgi:hypothetical protein
MFLLLVAGIGFGLGFVPALLFARSLARAALFVLLGFVLVAALFGFAWLTAPTSPGEADFACSDCGMWLGRWWEGWLVLYLGGVALVGWCLGVVAGALAGTRRTVQTTRA